MSRGDGARRLSAAVRYLRRWPVTAAILFATLIVAIVVEYTAPSSFQASGTVLVANPAVDHSRSTLRHIDVSAMVQEAMSPPARRDVLAAGGTDAYTVAQASPRRVQVDVTGDLRRATATAEIVLRRLSDALRREHRAADREAAGPLRSRLLIHVPSEGVVAAEGTAGGRDPSSSVVGTMVMYEQLAGRLYPLTAQQSADLLIATTLSDSSRQRITEEAGGDVSFALAPFDSDTPEMLELVFEAPDPERALAGFDRVVDALSSELDGRQANAAVPIGQRLLIEVIAEPRQAADTSPGVHLRTMLVTAFGLLAAAIGWRFADRRPRTSKEAAHPT